MLADKTVAVVGVGPGLGGEIARLAVRDGANVIVAARNAERLEETAQELGAEVLAVPTNISDAEQCVALMATATDRFGGLDAVVIVAAYDSHMGGIDQTSDEDWRNILEVNVVGTMHVIDAASKAMSNGGSIVQIGSQNARLASIQQLPYAASKGAMMSAQYHLVNELGPKKIRLNTVMPTWMWGPPVQGYVDYASQSRGISKEEVIGEITANMPLGEIPADEDVAEAVLFFCSDRARMITGQTLYVNAGEHQP
jgi:NAD(P)-dependent dehydrogenase (short-subunit alcohol dehydrogenase family)